MKAQAGTAENFPAFWQSFLGWQAKQEKKSPGHPKKEAKTEAKAEGQEQEKDAATGGTEPPKAITSTTIAAIVTAQDATGIAIADAMTAIGLDVNIRLAELDEVSGQRLLGYYKSR